MVSVFFSLLIIFCNESEIRCSCPTHNVAENIVNNNTVRNLIIWILWLQVIKCYLEIGVFTK